MSRLPIKLSRKVQNVLWNYGTAINLAIFRGKQMFGGIVFYRLQFFFFFLSLQSANIKKLHLQNCFNIPLMAMAGGM